MNNNEDTNFFLHYSHPAGVSPFGSYPGIADHHRHPVWCSEHARDDLVRLVVNSCEMGDVEQWVLNAYIGGVAMLASYADVDTATPDRHGTYSLARDLRELSELHNNRGEDGGIPTSLEQVLNRFFQRFTLTITPKEEA